MTSTDEIVGKLKSIDLPRSGFVRLPELIGPGKPIPISRSTLYDWIKKGLFPPPVALGPRVRAWPVETVRAFIAQQGGA